MTSHDEIPDWVPIGVAQTAPHLSLHTTKDGVNIKQRLLTDARMKSVWIEFKKQCVKCGSDNLRRNTQEFTKSDHLHPSVFTTVPWTFDDNETAYATFFIYAVTMLSADRPVTTRAHLRDAMAPYRQAAELCRIESKLAEVAYKRELQSALELVATHFQKHANWIENRNDPKILERSSGNRNDDKPRMVAIMLAQGTTALFGSVLAGSVGKIVEIALGLEPGSVKGKSVGGWCQTVAPQISTQA